MNELVTPQNITFTVGMISLLFVVYHYFKNPQIDIEKKDALMQQQIKITAEITDTKFKELQANFLQLLAQNQNHIHTLDTKVDALTERIASNNKELVRLSTIIDERIPKKS